MKKVSLMLLLLLAGFHAKSQNQTLWSYQYMEDVLYHGDTVAYDHPIWTYLVNGDSLFFESYNNPRDIAVDSDNNNIMVGQHYYKYMYMPDFTWNYPMQYSVIHIRKSNEDGDLIWQKYLEGGSSTTIPWAIETDANDNIIVAGFFLDTIDFDPGPGIFELGGPPGVETAFVLKLDPNGDFIDAKLLETTANSRILDIKVDENNDIYFAGKFRGTIDFDLGPGVINESTNAGQGELHVFKTDNDLNHIWHYHSPSYNESRVHELCLDDQSNVYLIGIFNDTVDFENNGSTTIPESIEDFYIMKISTDGDFEWVNTYAANGDSYPYSIDYDGKDIVFLAEFADSIDVNPQGVSEYLTAPSGDYSRYVQKLDTDGNHIWATELFTGWGSAQSIAINSKKQIVATGVLSHTAAILGDTILNETRPCLIWVDSLGTVEDYISWDDEDNTIPVNNIIDNLDNTLMAGTVEEWVDLDTTAAEHLIRGEGLGWEAFLFAFGKCWEQDLIVAQSCDSYTSPSGAYTWTSTGVYVDTIYTGGSCDSLITVDLTIQSIDNSVTQDFDTLTAVQSGVTYQWIDCDNGNMPIAGATDQEYIASSNGNYAVIIDNGMCSDTSICYEVAGLGMGEINQAQMTIFPNPTNGAFSIQISNYSKPYQLKITNSLGQVIYEEDNIEKGSIGVYLEYSGIYFIEVWSPEFERTVQKIVVQD